MQDEQARIKSILLQNGLLFKAEIKRLQNRIFFALIDENPMSRTEAKEVINELKQAIMRYCSNAINEVNKSTESDEVESENKL